MKFCLANDDRAILRTQLKKWGVLGKDWNPQTIDTVINLSIKNDKVQEMIEMMDEDKTRNEVQGLLDQSIFPFTYDVRESAKMNADFPDPGHWFLVCKCWARNMVRSRPI